MKAKPKIEPSIITTENFITYLEATLSYKQKGIFYRHFPTDSIAHITSFDGPVVDHWLEWKIAQTVNASTMQDPSAMQEDTNRYS